MPERPELDYVAPILDRELRGRGIAAVRVRKPVVMRLAVAGTPETLLVGRTINGVTRRGHFVLFALGGEPEIEIAVAPMLAGRFELAPATARTRADIAVAFGLDDGRELRYRDDVQMGKVYVLARGDHAKAPGLAHVGVDVLGPGFTRARFHELAARRRDQVKVFLLDKSALDAIGNAYADEILWTAGIHPKTMVRRLDADALDRLRDAIVAVLRHACAVVAERRPAIDEKVRDFLNVRGRAGAPCPRCNNKLRKARVRADDAIFCPRCQPDARGTSIVDWRRV